MLKHTSKSIGDESQHTAIFILRTFYLRYRNSINFTHTHTPTQTTNKKKQDLINYFIVPLYMEGGYTGYFASNGKKYFPNLINS